MARSSAATAADDSTRDPAIVKPNPPLVGVALATSIIRNTAARGGDAKQIKKNLTAQFGDKADELYKKARDSGLV